MQITKAEVIPMELGLRQPIDTACHPEIDHVVAAPFQGSRHHPRAHA